MTAASSAVTGDIKAEEKKSGVRERSISRGSGNGRADALTENGEHDQEVRERALDEDEDVERGRADGAGERARHCPAAVGVPSAKRGG